jgi:hypothetical protein
MRWPTRELQNGNALGHKFDHFTDGTEEAIELLCAAYKRLSKLDGHEAVGRTARHPYFSE